MVLIAVFQSSENILPICDFVVAMVTNNLVKREGK